MTRNSKEEQNMKILKIKIRNDKARWWDSIRFQECNTMLHKRVPEGREAATVD